MDIPIETPRVIQPNLAPMVLLVSGGQLGEGAYDRLVEFMKRRTAGDKASMLVVEALPLSGAYPAVPVKLKLFQLAYDATPVRFFIDYGTPESLILNCAIAAHEAARRAGDPVAAWDDLTSEQRDEVLAITSAILDGSMAEQQRAMREARGPMLECNPDPSDAEAVPVTDRHRLAMLFYGVVELMRIELDIVRAKGARTRGAALPPAEDTAADSAPSR